MPLLLSLNAVDLYLAISNVELFKRSNEICGYDYVLDFNGFAGEVVNISNKKNYWFVDRGCLTSSSE